MRVPRIRGFDKQSRPPVEETTSKLPVVESPPWNRRTAGVYSVGRTRGARQASDGGGQVIYLTGSIVLILHCIGDYERVYNGEVTPVGPWPHWGIERGSRPIFTSCGCLPGASFGLKII